MRFALIVLALFVGAGVALPASAFDLPLPGSDAGKKAVPATANRTSVRYVSAIPSEQRRSSSPPASYTSENAAKLRQEKKKRLERRERLMQKNPAAYRGAAKSRPSPATRKRSAR